MPKITCIIPARLNSTRLPRKVLTILHGKPLLQWVWEAATNTECFQQIIIAVDAKETADVARSFGADVLFTNPNCMSGTDRLIEIQESGNVHADIWVNWQGDEPFITRLMIEKLLQSSDSFDEEIWTLKRRIDRPAEIDSPHVVKVVCDAKGKALYFSRSKIPYFREPSEETIYYKHVGIYAFSDAALRKIGQVPIAPLEEAEKLEQLRYLYHGMKIRVHETDQEIFGIDTAEQLAKASQIMAYASL